MDHPTTRMDMSARKRATTLQVPGISAMPAGCGKDAGDAAETTVSHAAPAVPDVFENAESKEHEPDPASEHRSSNPDVHLPSTSDDLPIEIRSLSERFLDSLSAKVHPAPLTADDLSHLYQDFYERAASHIATHIAILSSRIGRSKTPPTASNARPPGKGRPRAGSGSLNQNDNPDSGNAGGGEMLLTAAEVAERKHARRLLERQRLALEEAVERAVCEKIYDKIWKHRTTDDEARDEKLRSRTAALALVGIGLKELHMDPSPSAVDDDDAGEVDVDVRKRATAAALEVEQEMHRSLADARDALQRMDTEHYPLGKLQHLKAAHKSIVETLSQHFPSSSSADEILPTLIYTLITSPQEGINVVSNLNFIQRFRQTSKVDGEAAYCLVNLEAAISFLETVDLSSLRADELPEGPPKFASQPSTPTTEMPHLPLHHFPPKPLQSSLSPLNADSSALITNSDSNSTGTSSPSNSPASTSTAGASNTNKPLPSPHNPTTPNSLSTRPPMHQRKLSSLVQQQTHRLEAGRDTFLHAADKVYDSINASLENSLLFVFGRFTEHQAAAAARVGSDAALPKTLADARKLVSSPVALLSAGEGGGSGSVGEDGDGDEALLMAGVGGSGRSSPIPGPTALVEDLTVASNKKADARVLELIGGRKPAIRDRSVDSARSGGSGSGSIGGGGSGGSGKRVGFAAAAPSIAESGNEVTDAKGLQPGHQQQKLDQAPPTPTAATTPGANNLFASINPLSRFQVPAFARFGRSASVNGALPALPPTVASAEKSIDGANKLDEIAESPLDMDTGNSDATPTATSALAPISSLKPKARSRAVQNDDEDDDVHDNNNDDDDDDADDEMNAREALTSLRKLRPPPKRFLEVQSAAELRIGEVEELLAEYRRLAKAIGDAVAA